MSWEIHNCRRIREKRVQIIYINRDKICPLEVKSGNYRAHKSLDVFCDNFSSRVREKYVVHTKDYKWENGINYIPVYMIPFL